MSNQAAPQPQRRKTWQREAVREQLRAQAGFVTAQELHRLLDENGQRIGLATVYRALGTLAEDGLADSIRNEDGDLYRFCDADEHHHHIVCRRCGFAEEIEDEDVEQWSARAARDHGFTEVSHIFEVFGICAQCSTGADSTPIS